MGNSTFNMDGYNDVPSRIAEFRAKYPDGRLRPADPTKPYEVIVVGQKMFIVYVAAAHRDADDVLPGVGCAWEPFPGPTPYTKDSELQNAETSAWGRAIIAALAADAKKGVASEEEIRNRRAAEEQAQEPTVDLWPYIKSQNAETGVHLLNMQEREVLAETWKADGHRFGPGAVPQSREREMRTLIDSYVGTHPEQPGASDSASPKGEVAPPTSDSEAGVPDRDPGELTPVQVAVDALSQEGRKALLDKMTEANYPSLGDLTKPAQVSQVIKWAEEIRTQEAKGEAF